MNIQEYSLAVGTSLESTKSTSAIAREIRRKGGLFLKSFGTGHLEFWYRL